MSKRNKLGSLLLFIYLFGRRGVNKIINGFLERRLKDAPEINFNENYATMLEDEFAELLMSLPYKPDPYKGGVDFTFLDPKYFFWKELSYGRDCDDYSYMWYLYHKTKLSKVYQYAVVPDYDVSRAHVVAVINIGEDYIIYDYDDKFLEKSLSKVMDLYFEKRYSTTYEKIAYAKLR